MKALVFPLSIGLASLTLPLQAGKILIDDFSGTLAPVSAISFQDGTMLGSELDVLIVGGLITAATFEVSGGNGILSNVETDDLGDDSMQLMWDGEDNTSALNFGLGTLDFTDGGRNDRFKLHVTAVTGSVRVFVRVWKTPADFSNYEIISIAAPGVYEVPFADFVHANEVLTMNSISQIGLLIYPDDNEGISIDRFEATGPISEDTTPPTVAADGKSKQKTQSSKIKLKGSASDNLALARVEVQEGKKPFRPAQLSGTRWTHRSGRLKEGNTTFTIRSVDANGNLSAIDKVKVKRG